MFPNKYCDLLKTVYMYFAIALLTKSATGSLALSDTNPEAQLWRNR